MSAEKVVFSLLNGSAGVMAIVGSNPGGAPNIWPVVSPDALTPPFVVYAFEGADRNPTISFGQVALVTSIMSVQSVARDYPTLKSLVAACRVAIAYQFGLIAGVQVSQITIAAEGPDQYQPELKLFGQSMRFSIVHQE